MPAIPFTDLSAAVHRRMLAALQGEPGVRIVQDSGPYIHATASSRIFRFVDDVELFADTAAHRLLFRSSSRLGHSDMGVNRARMERITARLRM